MHTDIHHSFISLSHPPKNIVHSLQHIRISLPNCFQPYACCTCLLSWHLIDSWNLSLFCHYHVNCKYTHLFNRNYSICNAILDINYRVVDLLCTIFAWQHESQNIRIICFVCIVNLLDCCALLLVYVYFFSFCVSFAFVRHSFCSNSSCAPWNIDFDSVNCSKFS